MCNGHLAISRGVSSSAEARNIAIERVGRKRGKSEQQCAVHRWPQNIFWTATAFTGNMQIQLLGKLSQQAHPFRIAQDAFAVQQADQFADNLSQFRIGVTRGLNGAIDLHAEVGESWPAAFLPATARPATFQARGVVPVQRW